MGRKNKPTALHKLQGTTNTTRHRSRENEPKPAKVLTAEPPTWLSDEQKEGWRFAIANMAPGQLAQIDRALLVAWVVAESRHRMAVEAQNRLNVLNHDFPLLMILKDANGRPVGTMPSQYLGIERNQASLMVKLASELGFSPAARPRLAAGTGTALLPPELGANEGDQSQGDNGNDIDAYLARNPQSLSRH